MFRLREIPAGADRREALLHWVREHWRRRRKNPDEEVKIRRHFNGVERFTWADLECKVVPAPDDVATAERLRQEREAEKAAGLTIRPRDKP